jgi:hypothetical protein
MAILTHSRLRTKRLLHWLSIKTPAFWQKLQSQLWPPDLKALERGPRHGKKLAILANVDTNFQENRQLFLQKMGENRPKFQS